MVDDQVERVVKGGHGSDNTYWLILRERNFPERSSVKAHRYHMPCIGAQDFDAVENALDPTIHFH
ncbi:hypothetical protein D3C81_1914040 [compost metagenome]